MIADYRAPAMRVFVNGTKLETDITQHIVSASYEHTLEMADKMSLVVENAGHKFTDSFVFSPGNEIDLWLGWGRTLKFIGRAEIIRHLPTFPGDGVPTIEIVGYDRSHRLMKQEVKISGGGGKRPKAASKESGRMHRGTVEGVAAGLLSDYGIATRVAEYASLLPVNAMQKKGTSDYKFLKALANLHELDFVIEWQVFVAPKGLSPTVADAGGAGAPKGQWVGRLTQDHLQERLYSFEYGTGPDATLMSVDLEYALPQSPTELQVWVWNRGKKDWVPVTVQGTKPGKLEAFGQTTLTNAPKQAGEVESMTQVKLAVEGHSIEVVTGRKFRNASEAATWARGWFDKHKDAFVTAKGKLPGVEGVRAGDTHELKGIGKRYSGRYNFTSVTHSYGDQGYILEFTARKVVGD